MQLNALLILAVLMFCSGLLVVITRKNAIMVLIGIELMLNAANLNLITFSRFDPQALQGQIFTLFVITVAVAEAVVALALVFKVYHYFQTVDLDKVSTLKK